MKESKSLFERDRKRDTFTWSNLLDIYKTEIQ